ncbi:MAG: hypothetical protein K9M11_04145 [Candidatus Pacebacteria bacterium]|nr:hypothetical protein [Candidatus Paceibacterota bacterium]
MKIVALLPVKNEGWVLDTYLSSLNSFCDLIVALDDGSTDNTLEILNKHNVVTVKNDYKGDNWAEHSMRQKLLEIGRENGGTHFVCLDGDEAFSSGFRGEEARSTILNLKKGETLAFRWVTLWKSINTERIDEPWDNLYKDFVFCDDEKLEYKYKFMHVSRTPEYSDNTPKKVIKVEDKNSVVLHFKFYNYSRTLYNLAWYRCSELIHNIRPAKKINLMYGITLDSRNVKKRVLDNSLFKDLPIPSLTSTEDS